jgi:hypothetical protein
VATQEDVVSLSRDEQRALDEIERALLVQDQALSGRIRQGSRRSVRRGTCMVGLLAGVMLLAGGLAGASPAHLMLAVAGYSLVVASGFAAIAETIRRRRCQGRRRTG